MLNASSPQKRGGGVFANNSTALTESEQELFAFIQRNDSGGVRSTLKNLLEKFGRKPYGWHYATVLCLLASLYAHGKIEIRTDGNLLEEDEQQLERVLRNTHSHGNVVLSPQVEYTASQLRDIKDFFEDFFDIPSSASEAKTLGKEIDKALQNLIEKIASLIEQTSQYPFLGELMPVLEKLKELAGKNDNWYLTKLIAQKSALFDMKKDVIDPVCKFMSGSQKDIFDNARAFVQIHQTNFAHIEGNEAKQLVTRINDPECFKDNRIRQIKTQTEEMQRKVNSQINAEISKTKEKIADLKDRICGMNEFRALNGEQQRKITLPFNDVNASIENQKLIAVIRDTLNRFEENEYSELLSQMTLWGQPTPNETTPEPNESTVPEYVLCQTIKISFEKAWLADEADVSRYLESMRKAFLEEINKGKRIQV